MRIKPIDFGDPNITEQYIVNTVNTYESLTDQIDKRRLSRRTIIGLIGTSHQLAMPDGRVIRKNKLRGGTKLEIRYPRTLNNP